MPDSPGAAPDNPLRINRHGAVVSILVATPPRIPRRDENTAPVGPVRRPGIYGGPPSVILTGLTDDSPFFTASQIRRAQAHDEGDDFFAPTQRHHNPVNTVTSRPTTRRTTQRSTTTATAAFSRPTTRSMTATQIRAAQRRGIPVSEHSPGSEPMPRQRATTPSGTRWRANTPSASATRVRRGDKTSTALRAARERGLRPDRNEPLTPADLYTNGIPRPERAATRDHHKCAVCSQLKSHPVTSPCGHSHCFVCIRLRVEEDWTCPTLSCGQKMYGAPIRVCAEEASILEEHGDWDPSEVSYSFEDLTFPRRAIVEIESD